MLQEPQKKLKPWGHEIWFAHTSNYAGKVLFVKKGHRLSLQYHEQKTETLFVFSGKIKFSIGQTEDTLQEKVLEAGMKIDVTPPTIHRAEALEDSYIFEVSTPHLEDVVKLADDYGRTGKGNNEELDSKLSAS